MNNSVIRDCWNVILQKGSKTSNDALFPLANVQDYLAYFQLPPLPSAESKMDVATDIRSTEPGFGNLTDEILLGLRCHIYAGAELDAVAAWAEKLMRFCEVRYPVLKQRAVEKWKDSASAKLHILHLSAFFLDYAVRANDVRFLNTVLKLVDLKWVVQIKTIKHGLNAEADDLVSALFLFRIILMTEYILERIREGGAL